MSIQSSAHGHDVASRMLEYGLKKVEKRVECTKELYFTKKD